MLDSAPFSVWSLVDGDEVGVLGVAADVAGDERAERNDRESTGSQVVERVPYESAAEAVSLEARLDVGVDENDRARSAAVADLAGELAVDVELVAKLAGIVGHRDVHGIGGHGGIIAGQRVPSA
jgi:hypothetical protein